jgi:hypothetical protein
MGIFFGKKKSHSTPSRGIRKSKIAVKPKKKDTRNLKPPTQGLGTIAEEDSSPAVIGCFPGSPAGKGKKATEEIIMIQSPEKENNNIQTNSPSHTPIIKRTTALLIAHSSASAAPLTASSVEPQIIENNNNNVDQHPKIIANVVNIYSISINIFNMTRVIMTVQDWDNADFLQHIVSINKELDFCLKPLRDNDSLKDWAQPLNYRKVGSVLGAGRRLIRAYDYFLDSTSLLISNNGKNFGQTEQRQLKENLKIVVECLLKFLMAAEMVVPTDFATEVSEFVKSFRETIDTSRRLSEYYFDDVARICLTSAIRVQRLTLWKSIQVNNPVWSTDINNSSYTITKASKVLYHVGLKHYNHPEDPVTYTNLSALTKSLTSKIRSFREMVQNDPPEEITGFFEKNPEIIAEYISVYDQGIKEVVTSMKEYKSNYGEDLTVIGSINKIITQLQTIKKSC